MSEAQARTGVLLCGHGSRDEDTKVEFDRFVDATRRILAARTPIAAIEGAYLEFYHPTLEEGLTHLVQGGLKRIVAQPLMLFAGRHAKADIPEAVRAFATTHGGVRFDCGQNLSLNSKLLAAAVARVGEVMKRSATPARNADSVLLAIGRGAADTDANDSIAELASLMRDALGMAHAEIAFAGIAEPSIAEGLIRAARLGCRRVVVFPYFLFTGILVKRISLLVEETARANPTIEFLVAAHLSDHPLVIETVAEAVLGVS